MRTATMTGALGAGSKSVVRKCRDRGASPDAKMQGSVCFAQLDSRLWTHSQSHWQSGIVGRPAQKLVCQPF